MAGDEYICEVSPNISYRFFVLSENGDKTVNLIMERNICYDGTQTDIGKICLASWNKSNDSKSGPVTAMNYLYNATKDWINIPNIGMDYIDEGQTIDFGYESIKTEGNITNITKKGGTKTATYKNLKARLPYKSEVFEFNKSNLWMYNYLRYNSNVNGDGLQNIDEDGYWTLSSGGINTTHAWRVVYNGTLANHDSNDHGPGVRPVITLPTSLIFDL